jgi:hypothetical protein
MTKNGKLLGNSRNIIVASIAYLLLAGGSIYFSLWLAVAVHHSLLLHVISVIIIIAGLGWLVAKVNKVLPFILSVMILLPYLWWMNIIIVEKWCYPPKDFANHRIRHDIKSLFSDTDVSNVDPYNVGWSATYGFYRYSCEADFNLAKLVLSKIKPEIWENWHEAKVAELEKLALQSYQREIQVFFADDNLRAHYVDRVEDFSSVDSSYSYYFYWFVADGHYIVISTDSGEIVDVVPFD